jgi:hypothetical protein
MTEDDPDDLSKLRLEPGAVRARVPAKIQKRQEHFIRVPMWWYEKLANPLPATRCTVPLALHLLYLNWKSRGEPFKLANGTLRYDGIGRHTKRHTVDQVRAGHQPAGCEGAGPVYTVDVVNGCRRND